LPGVMTAAFNLTVLSHILGTPFEPDLNDHILMVEDVSEYLYSIDRAFFHVTANANVRKIIGLRLGRLNDLQPNDCEFHLGEEEIALHWCEQSGIPYLGRADIGHDAANKIVPFGMWEG
jgi:muramoyltetrapeptide carboxypeptidase